MSSNSGNNNDDANNEMANTVAAAAAAAAVEAITTTASSTTTETTMAAATTAAMGIMMMDPSVSLHSNLNTDGGGDDAGNDECVVAPGMESTGRWTKQEHNKFLLGIEKYGKEWKKVAAFVRTRTVMQTRTHAQKFYEKLSQVALKATGSPLPSKSTSATAKPIIMSTSSSASHFPSVTTKKLTGGGGALGFPSSSSSTNNSNNNAFVHHGSNSATLVVPPIPVVSFTELDILVPINDATASRPSNKIYMDMMKINCFIFHSLPITEQLWFARNIVHFLSSVRHHRWIGCNYYGTAPQYQLLNEPVSVVQSDFRMDPLKVAAFSYHPLWLLGDHDIHKVHHGQPFIHRTVDGTWKHVTMSQVKDILNGEGPKNLLLLPSSIPAMVEPVTGTVPVPVVVPVSATTTTILPAPATTATTTVDEVTVPTTTVHEKEEDETKVEATVLEVVVEVKDDDNVNEETKNDDGVDVVVEEESLVATPTTNKRGAIKSKALPMASATTQSTPSKRSASTTTTAKPVPAVVPPPSEEKHRRPKRSKV